jgi:2-polyprenyl-6-methoxyphenol hydroxylase-like FAD-dependent oxidoreductase
MSHTMTQQPRICILGGGFGGLYTALKLTQFPWSKAEKPEIVLIDQRDRFLFSPLLYELLTGELETWEISPPYIEPLANTGIQFVQAEVARSPTGAYPGRRDIVALRLSGASHGGRDTARSGAGSG